MVGLEDTRLSHDGKLVKLEADLRSLRAERSQDIVVSGDNINISINSILVLIAVEI